ncbi:MAG: hypothetical protein IPP07_23040 [Holophagales bacterium]|jgi:hypothetical protein|nr:hypothetical protein [Holophagales bacterium]MBK9967592.1 hypothetical protein [Holophagales bacterium]
MSRWLGVAAAALLVVTSGCGEGLRDTPTEPANCKNVAGSYVSSYGNSCGRYSNGDAATVTQSGCTIEATVKGVGALTGTINGSSVTWTVELEGDCEGSGTGAGKIDGKQISGTYAGFLSGTNCCASTLSGTFLLSAK